MDFQWILMDCLMDLHGLFKGFEMDCLMDLKGILKEFLWVLIRGYPMITRDISMEIQS